MVVNVLFRCSLLLEMLLTHLPHTSTFSLSHATALASACSGRPLWLCWPHSCSSLSVLEQGIVSLYNTLQTAAISLHKPLWNTTVIPTAHCGYDPVLEKGLTEIGVWEGVEEDMVTANTANERRVLNGLPSLPLLRIQTEALIPSTIQIPPSTTTTTSPHVGEHAIVCLGGTFDHLHAGHKVLLTSAALWSKDKVMCGMTVPAMLSKKSVAHQLQSYEERCQAVIDFVSVVRRVVTALHVPISDGYGNTVDVRDLTALVVSEETKSGGEAINAERERRGYPKLTVHAVSLVGASGTETAVGKLSSTIIRKYIDSGEQDLSLFLA